MSRTPGKKPSAVDVVAGEADKAGESALARWSRRKAATRNQDTPMEDRVIEDRQEIPDNAESINSGPIKVPTDDDMPPLESLDEHSDYSAFLSPGVSERLRKLALRKLFHLDVYNFCDGLDDYAEDYTKFAALGNILTADVRLQQQRAEKQRKEQSQMDRENLDTGSMEITEEKLGEDPVVPDNDSDETEMAAAGDSRNSNEEQRDKQSKNHRKNRA